LPPDALDRLAAALEAEMFADACDVASAGRQKIYLHEYGQSEYTLAFLPKVEIEAWVEDARAAELLDRITQIAHTGRMGDGKVFVLSLTAFQNA
jgi:nitrogen regulatory protein PII